MARRANRGRGWKKTSKVNLKEAKAVMEDVSRYEDCDIELSEDEENCNSRICGDQLDNELEVDRQCLLDASIAVVEVNNLEETNSDLIEIEAVHNLEAEGAKEGHSEGVHETAPTQDWRQLFRSEKSLGMLHYFAPSKEDGRVVVKPPKEAIEEGILKLSPSLVGQFLDKPLPCNLVYRAVKSLWAQYGKVEVFLLENGLYLFRFADEKTRDDVMEAKIWLLVNKPLILRKWTPGMQLLKLSLSTVPVWIKLHNLPIEFWNTTCLSYLASGVGKPLCADSVTEEQLRIGYARVLVEVSVESDFPKEIEIVGADGSRVVVGIEYPWIPVKCHKCKSFCHLTHTCTKIEKQVWIPKKSVPVIHPQVDIGTKKGSEINMKAGSRIVDKEQWSVVKSAMKTPMSKISARENYHWTNSFHLLARVDGRCGPGEVRDSGPKSQSLQEAIEFALNEENTKNKGKGKLREEEILMRGFSPTA